MAKIDTVVYNTERRSRFEIRVTPKKLFVDRINLDTGESSIAFYVQVQEVYDHGTGPVKKYYSSAPSSSYCDSGTSLSSIIWYIEDRYDITVPEEAIDLFESRNMMRELVGKKEKV